MIKGVRTGTQVVQTYAVDENLVEQKTVSVKEVKTKSQLGIGGVSYASETIKQQLGSVENGTQTLIDEIHKQRSAEQMERSDVQQQQDMMAEQSRAQQQQQEQSRSGEQQQPQEQSRSWWSEIWHFFSS